ncbi:MAG: hypothetical protein ACI4KR_09150 [Ruminiclostridium sp.]
MGNRAIIKPVGEGIGVYLHWNGGIDSVTAFLKYCELRSFRPFGGRGADGYGIARFCQVVANYLGGDGLSIGVESGVKETEEWAEGIDNGIYVIDGWQIVKRIGTSCPSEGYVLLEMLISIDDAQPASQRIGKAEIANRLENSNEKPLF